MRLRVPCSVFRVPSSAVRGARCGFRVHEDGFSQTDREFISRRLTQIEVADLHEFRGYVAGRDQTSSGEPKNK